MHIHTHIHIPIFHVHIPIFHVHIAHSGFIGHIVHHIIHVAFEFRTNLQDLINIIRSYVSVRYQHIMNSDSTLMHVFV